MKRGANLQINSEGGGFDEEEESQGFTKASKSVMSRRKIIQPKGRNLSFKSTESANNFSSNSSNNSVNNNSVSNGVSNGEIPLVSKNELFKALNEKLISELNKYNGIINFKPIFEKYNEFWLLIENNKFPTSTSTTATTSNATTTSTGISTGANKKVESSDSESETEEIKIQGPSFTLSSKPTIKNSPFTFGEKKKPVESDSDSEIEIKGPVFTFNKKINDDVFKLSNKPIDKPIETSKPAFSLGDKSDKPVETSKPAFSFGEKSDKPADTPFSFGGNESSKPTFAFGDKSDNPVDKPTFGFGDKSDKPTFGFGSDKSAETTKPAFSFGAGNTEKPVDSSKPAFSFGDKSNKPAEKPAFSFGDKSDKPAEKPAFSFGSNTDKPAESTKPTFLFGSNKPANPIESSDKSSDKPSDKPLFSFGDKSESSKPFSFGSTESSKPESSEPSAFSFNKPSETKSDEPTKPVFAFGSSNNSTKPAFSFGSNDKSDKPFAFGSGNTDKSESTESTKPAFSFGSTTDKPAFSFGSASTFSFSKPSESQQKQSTQSTESDKKEEEDKLVEEEVEGNFKPIVKLNPIETNNENNEILKYSKRTKLMLFNKSSNPPYTSKGIGELKILSNNDTGKSRVLVIADGGLRTIFNQLISKDFNYDLIGDGLVRFPVVNSDKVLETFVFKVKTKSDGEELLRKLNEFK